MKAENTSRRRSTGQSRGGLREQGLRAFGAWEPLSFRLRSGPESATGRTEDDYAWEHTEEFIKGLKERGFNLFITHFSKGRGITAEAEEREDTRTIARICHKHGLYVGGYIRYSTFIPETFKLDDPDCVAHMAAVGSKGLPRYAHQYWRYMPCPSSPEFMEYLDKLIGIGIEDIGIDCLHVDGVALEPEPYACHCPRCEAAFRAWVKQRYPTAKAQKARFGFAPLDYVEIPDVSIYEPMAQPVPIIGDPVAQEWMFFRCQLLTKIWKFIVNAARSRKPDCLVQGNACFCPDLNPFWFFAKDLAQLAGAGNDGFFTEEGLMPELYGDGRLHGHFETFKKLRGMGLQVFTYNFEPDATPITDPERLKRAMAHQMAFNLDSVGVHMGKTDGDKWPTVAPEYMAFHRDCRHLFRDAVQAHDVALYFSERNYALNSGTPMVTQNLARDVMMRGHVPFGYLLAERRDEMGKFRAMVLPELESLTDSEASDIAAYVRGGGGLLVLGSSTGRYDEYRRLRRKNALASGLGVGWDDASSAFTARVGKGRVAFVPQLQSPDGTPAELLKADLAQKNRFSILRPQLWRPPLNAADMLERLEWASGGYRFDVLAPNAVVVEFARQSARERYLIHLVNYDLGREVGPFEINCHVPVRSVRAFTPDGKSPKVRLGSAKSKPSIQVDGFERYLILTVS